jgi:hypothetical protein
VKIERVIFELGSERFEQNLPLSYVTEIVKAEWIDFGQSDYNDVGRLTGRYDIVASSVTADRYDVTCSRIVLALR